MVRLLLHTGQLTPAAHPTGAPPQHTLTLALLNPPSTCAPSLSPAPAHSTHSGPHPPTLPASPGTCSSQLLESKALSSTGPNCLASPDGTRALVLSVSGSLTLQNLATGANMWAVAADAGRGATAPFSLTMRASGRIMLVDANNNMIFQSAAPSGGEWLGGLEMLVALSVWPACTLPLAPVVHSGCARW